MDPAPLGVELQLQHLLLHARAIWPEQSNTRWLLRFKAREGNWIFTFPTSRPDSCWFHLGKLPWASAEIRVQHAGKLPSSISWEQEQPTEELIHQESPYGSTQLPPCSRACSHQEFPGTTGKSLHCSSAHPQLSQRDARGAGGSLPWRQVTCPAPEAPALAEVLLDPGKGSQEVCGHRHQPGQDLGADSWLMGNDKLLYWLFTCAQIRWLRNLGAYRD